MSDVFSIFVHIKIKPMAKKILTPLELKVMNILWTLEKAFIKDILKHWGEEPVPAYNTVSTIVRILAEKKGFIDYEAHGRTHEYFPVISREDYQGTFLNNALKNVFKGSVSSLVSALIDNKDVSKTELEELKKLIN